MITPAMITRIIDHADDHAHHDHAMITRTILCHLGLSGVTVTTAQKRSMRRYSYRDSIKPQRAASGRSLRRPKMVSPPH